MNSITYLSDAGNILGSAILKSYIFKKCYEHAEEENLNISAKSRNVLLRCPKCLNDRDQGNTTYRTKAEVKDKFAAKLSKKKELTKFQYKYLKKARAGNHNKMVISCTLCGHSVTKEMKKPEKPVKPRPKAPEQRAKKKKKKDRYSGLNVTAVRSAKEVVIEKSAVQERSSLRHEKKNAKKYKNKLQDMLSAKTKTSKGLMEFLESI